ncbi:MAG: HEAT repeat domain-containing protein [Nitrospiraceae bacterium]|nr:HEAT repeat domain-containing protein [Nitrospiraceae bacterium]
MDLVDDIKPAQELIVALQKAKKNLRMYPVNNPVYARTIEETYRKFEEFLEQQGDFELRVRQNEIFLGEHAIYQAVDKDDNLAFFFFKDGVRTLAFKRGLAMDELREFLQAISFDFERQGNDEDVVTLLWEKDFDHIKYAVDENFLLEDEVYESEATTHAKVEMTEQSELKKAYEEVLKEEFEHREIEVMPITNADLIELVNQIENDSSDKARKFTGILFELFQTASPAEYPEIAELVRDSFEYSVRSGDLLSAVHMLEEARKKINESTPDLLKKNLEMLFVFASSQNIIKMLGEHLDSGLITEDGVFADYVQHLDKEAISSFISILGELKTIEARKILINALAFLGNKDIQALARGLSDPRWYVVRNIIYIFRKIGDRRAVEFLVRAVNHSDTRVRMEVLRALGELGGQGVVQTLKEALGDPEPSIRTTAARALGRIRTEAAKKIMLQKVSDKGLGNLDMNEKKEYFEVLANWNNEEVIDFLMKTLKATSFFKKARRDELKACAAYTLGLLGHKEALSHLQKLRGSKNRLLSEYAYNAIKRIEYGN